MKQEEPRRSDKDKPRRTRTQRWGVYADESLSDNPIVRFSSVEVGEIEI